MRSLRFLRTRYICTAVFLLSGALAAACGSGDDTPSGSTSAASSTGSPAGTFAGPAATITTGSLPSGFPDDFPLYENAEPVSGSEGPNGISARLETTDEFSKVVEFYKEALARTPWQITGENPTEGQDADLFTFGHDDAERPGGTVGIVTPLDSTGTLIFISFYPS